jgi:hypothetical protein
MGGYEWMSSEERMVLRTGQESGCLAYYNIFNMTVSEELELGLG